MYTPAAFLFTKGLWELHVFENIFITLDALPSSIPKGFMSTSGIEPGRLGDCTLEPSACPCQLQHQNKPSDFHRLVIDGFSLHIEQICI